ncbi:MAG TPA: N-formylglutamate deformylase [Woeseiaceae bacterium]|nr:N-formylglutamate deformylase [Woeseiaceae bacterium]
MHETYTFLEGSTPLVISVPHDGRDIPAKIRERMTPAGLDMPDTDWHVARLYDFAGGLGASLLIARNSRYVVDLNRSSSDDALYPGQAVTGLTPVKTFAGDEIYLAGETVSDDERQTRVERFWQPYHRKLELTLRDLRAKFSYALLWDAHSIASELPLLFDGQLPVLNLGSYDERSCAPHISNPVFRLAEFSNFDAVLNGRFKGGYITRHYGDPENNVHALQLEIAQRSYMDEASREFQVAKADKLRDLLGKMLQAFQEGAARHYE